jgi:hypothetical protein
MASKDISEAFGDLDKSSAWVAILTGLAASGELSPETLGQKGGLDRVKTLAVHAANLSKVFHSEFVKANAKDIS